MRVVNLGEVMDDGKILSLYGPKSRGEIWVTLREAKRAAKHGWVADPKPRPTDTVVIVRK